MEKDERLRVGELNSGMKIQLLLDMQEHPEQFSEQALQTMLDDLEMREMMEATALLKQAMMNDESNVNDVDAEWQRFAQAHLTDERPERSWLKIAATVIGILMMSGIALAAIRIVRHYQKPETPQVTDTIAVASPQRSTLNSQLEETDTLAVEPRIFDNVPLDTMLSEMADYYHISVKFERKEARLLRFHFVWKRTDNLDRLVEKLNNFEAVNIIREPEKLIVK